jgi:hypothetical protein
MTNSRMPGHPVLSYFTSTDSERYGGVQKDSYNTQIEAAGTNYVADGCSDRLPRSTCDFSAFAFFFA